MAGKPPLWVVLAVQSVSVIGDLFGQRCSRAYHSQSRRKFMISLTTMSCLQMLVVLGFIQLAFPHLSSVVYGADNQVHQSELLLLLS